MRTPPLSPAAVTLVAVALVTVLSCVAAARVIVVEAPKSSGQEADFQRAKASGADANTAFQAGDMEEALAHGEAAYRAYPNASTAITMGDIYAHTDRHVDAFRWFLVARNSRPSEAHLRSIQAALKLHGAAAKLGVVSVDAVPASATLSVDGVDGGKGKPEAGTFFGVSFGEYKVVVQAPGFLPLTLDVVVSDITEQTVSAKLEAAAVESASIGLPLGLVVGGLVVVGAGVGLHVWGLGASGDLETANPGWAGQGLSLEEARAEHDSKQNTAATGTTAAFAMYGVGAAVIVTGAVLWALQSGGGASERSAEVVPAPVWVPGGGAVSLGGTF